MVSELMNLSAIETGNFTIKRSPLDISSVVKEAADSCAEKAKEKEIELSVNVEASGGQEKVLADKGAMFSVFANLIDNAIKYTPEKGHVLVRTESTGNYVKVIVRDDGIGMTDEEKGRVFDEFFRARNKYTAKVPGTGLGLTIAKSFVDLHHGKITVETAPGRGSTFTVLLPKWQENK
jgi:two-component system phosphate regulon sensor histidine kinase PhoR